MTDEHGLIHATHDVEIEFLDNEDYEKPGYAGEGWYFHVRGVDARNGPYDSRDEAAETVPEALFDSETSAIVRELNTHGYARVYDAGPEEVYARDDFADSVRFAFVMEYDRVNVYTQFGKVVEENGTPTLYPDGGRSVADSVDIDAGGLTHGHRLAAVRSLLRSLEPGFDRSAVREAEPAAPRGP